MKRRLKFNGIKQKNIAMAIIMVTEKGITIPYRGIQLFKT